MPAPVVRAMTAPVVLLMTVLAGPLMTVLAGRVMTALVVLLMTALVVLLMTALVVLLTTAPVGLLMTVLAGRVMTALVGLLTTALVGRVMPAPVERVEIVRRSARRNKAGETKVGLVEPCRFDPSRKPQLRTSRTLLASEVWLDATEGLGASCRLLGREDRGRRYGDRRPRKSTLHTSHPC
jgi:hypothetical protein